MSEKAGKKVTVRWLLPIAAILVIVASLMLLYGRRQVRFQELSPVGGVMDLTQVNLSDEVYRLNNFWAFYPETLLTSEDYAAGRHKGLEDKSGKHDDACPYGTYRLEIVGRPNESYTICGFSVGYSTRVYINGHEFVNYGFVADRAEDFTPATEYMTLPFTTDSQGRAEIIYQYANFVHPEGGYIQPTYISTPQRMEEYKTQNLLISYGMGGALFVLAFYFMLSAGFQRRLELLILAFCCVVTALRDQFFFDALVTASASWYFKYRLFIGDVCLLPVFMMLLLRQIYHLGNRWVILAYCAINVAALVLIALLDTHVLVKINVVAYSCAIPYLIYLLVCLVIHFIREKRLDRSDFVIGTAYLLLLITVIAEALGQSNSFFLTQFGLTPIGMLIFTLLTSISISLRTQRQEAELAKSRAQSEALQRMNAMNLDFLHKIAHELKTPLTVISG